MIKLNQICQQKLGIHLILKYVTYPLFKKLKILDKRKIRTWIVNEKLQVILTDSTQIYQKNINKAIYGEHIEKKIELW